MAIFATVWCAIETFGIPFHLSFEFQYKVDEKVFTNSMQLLGLFTEEEEEEKK